MENGVRLHVFGPAWGLPSIDADCIAAIALAKLYCRDRHIPLTIVSSHHHENGLPALQNGTTWVAYGINAISRHILRACDDDSTHNSTFSTLTPDQQARATALTTLLQVQGQQVLDVNLYVSSDNYHQATKPAFTKILPWYANYLVPPRRRHAAQSRTEHLGVSSADPDIHGSVIDSQPSGSALGGLSLSSSTSPSSSRKTSHEKHADLARAFRLKAITDAFLEPLDAALADKTYLLDTARPAVVDCIAYAYLALILRAETPSRWAADALRTGFPRLEAYAARLRDVLDPNQDQDQESRDGEIEEGNTVSRDGQHDDAAPARTVIRREREIVTPWHAASYTLSALLAFLPGHDTSLAVLNETNAAAGSHDRNQSRLLQHRVLPAVVSAVVLAGPCVWYFGAVAAAAGAARRAGWIRAREPIQVFLRHGRDLGGGAAGGLLRGVDLSRA